MYSTDPTSIFEAVAVEGTTAYVSKVSYPTGMSMAYSFDKVGDAAGVLTWETNNQTLSAYNAGVSAASGTTAQEKEGNNTSGWFATDLQPTATAAVAATDPVAVRVLLSSVAFKRSRFRYTNATGTGTLNGNVNQLSQ